MYNQSPIKLTHPPRPEQLRGEVGEERRRVDGAGRGGHQDGGQHAGDVLFVGCVGGGVGLWGWIV